MGFNYNKKSIIMASGSEKYSGSTKGSTKAGKRKPHRIISKEEAGTPF